MVRIRPGLELVWRTTTTLQIGVPDALAIVEGVTGGIDWLVARLRGGTTESAAIAAAVRHGATRAEARAALDAIRPVLIDVDPAGLPRTTPGERAVALRTASARGEAFRLIAHTLADRGVDVLELDTDELPPPGRVLLEIADFVVPPRRAQPLMAADVPHAAVLLGDHSIEVTPLILPGHTPCLRCADLARRDADETWPVVASQLVGRVAALRSTVEVGFAAAVAAGVADARSTQPAYRIDLVTGAASTSRWAFHSECGCRAVPGSEMGLDAGRALPRRRSSGAAIAVPA